MSDSRVSVMKDKYYAELNSRRNQKAKNCVYIDNEHYTVLINDVSNAKLASKKTSRDYWLLKRYDILKIDQKTKLIFPMKESGSNILYYVSDGELFDALHEAHVSIGHGGRDRMIKELSNQYKNITRYDIELYIQLCEPCQQKQKGIKKGIVVKPIISSEFNSRCQVDLIDFQSHPDGEYKFILVYQDHLTKFVVLRSLKSKRAEEVAYVLLDIFTLIGAPAILQSDNGREFANQIVCNLKQYWPSLNIAHGKPRHSQSQGSVERANQDIENMLTTWMQDNNTGHWNDGLRFVQLMKNKVFHSGIKRTPYEALFGCKVKVGITLPNDVAQNLETEEDLEMVINNTTQGNAQREPSQNVTPKTSKSHDLPAVMEDRTKKPLCCVCLEETTGTQSCRECKEPIHSICAVLEKSENDEGGGSQILCPLCSRNIVATKNRHSAKENLKQQAEKMLKQSDKKFPPVPVGTTVRIPVPEVDRGRGDARNILAIVIRQTDDGLYQLGTKQGVVKSLYARSQFTVCQKGFLDIKDVPDAEITLRSVATLQSTGTGQGFVKCSCKKSCGTMKCLCVKNKTLCSSKCHSSLPCKNK